MDNQFETKFINGDKATIQGIYTRLGPKVIGYVINKGGTKADGEEVFQIAMFAIRQNMRIGKYKDLKKFDHYFVKIAMNTWSNELRRRKREQKQNLDNHTYHIIDDSKATLEAKIVKDRQLDALYRALKMLDKACRELIYGHYYDKQKLKDIAEELGEKKGTIRVRLKRCRDKIKKWMGK